MCARVIGFATAMIVSLAATVQCQAQEDDAELVAAKELVAEAKEACEAFAKVKRNSPELKQACFGLARACVNVGDVDGAMAALKRVNTKNDYSVCNVWVMRTEATGRPQPDPKVEDQDVLDKHRLGAARCLITAGRDKEAFEQIDKMPDGQPHNVILMLLHIETAKRHWERREDLETLESYQKAMEAAENVDDPKQGIPAWCEICQGFVDVALEPAAEILAGKMEGALEDLPPTAQTIDFWLKVARVRLLLGDDAAYEKDVDTAKAIYKEHGEPRTGHPWESSLLALREQQYRWEALRKRDQPEALARALTAWEATLNEVDSQFKKPNDYAALIEALLMAEQYERAWKIADELDPPTRGLVLMAIRQHPESRKDPKLNLAMGEYCAKQNTTPKEEVLRAAALSLACECFTAAEVQDKFQAAFAEAVKISEKHDRMFHPALAGLLVELERFDDAREFTKSLPTAERALSLSTLAEKVTSALCKKRWTVDK